MFVLTKLHWTKVSEPHEIYRRMPFLYSQLQTTFPGQGYSKMGKIINKYELYTSHVFTLNSLGDEIIQILRNIILILLSSKAAYFSGYNTVCNMIK